MTSSGRWATCSASGSKTEECMLLNANSGPPGPPSVRLLMYHDDDCGELINAAGICPRCEISPDMQSLGFRLVTETEMDEKRRGGATFMGQYRTPVY